MVDPRPRGPGHEGTRRDEGYQGGESEGFFRKHCSRPLFLSGAALILPPRPRRASTVTGVTPRLSISERSCERGGACFSDRHRDALVRE
ncbi:hypothetical protein B005_2324 [Nocardiopsis alba ATCC BAA-2165]|uniref:Uncharacterized protein n=1 Tax=Nocardiopsis alba (strain ATCC BAA-2165 / BE74) TaxID=1205910 RepID=J7L442_NOCAA|nr:hypothetical protein B005_2324 [Nocardiopsis alba ATCC BAA-2165]